MALREQGIKVAAKAKAKSLTQWPLLVVIGICGLGLVLVFFGHWRIGTSLFGFGLVFGALERIVLPRRVAGMLNVRSRLFDVIALAGMGLSILILAFLVPAVG